MSGIRKFPRTAGATGTRKKKTMMMPWMENSLLYVSAATRSPAGVSNSSRMSDAAVPPIMKKKLVANRYSRAIRLWSCVRSHDPIP